MTALQAAAAIGAAFGLGFWAGGRWWLARFVWAVANGHSETALRLRAALRHDDASGGGQ